MTMLATFGTVVNSATCVGCCAAAGTAATANCGHRQGKSTFVVVVVVGSSPDFGGTFLLLTSNQGAGIDLLLNWTTAERFKPHKLQPITVFFFNNEHLQTTNLAILSDLLP
uniref:(northern house mosquito) hypothetical protein n=1 Tax=Culex pipiens TaxID=7175 RepID=A0A8D8KKB7_CULPI